MEEGLHLGHWALMLGCLGERGSLILGISDALQLHTPLVRVCRGLLPVITSIPRLTGLHLRHSTICDLIASLLKVRGVAVS